MISGNVTISANIPNITIQTSTSLQVGVGVANSNTATIYSYATPFTLGLANTISTVNANFSGNVAVSNLSVANFVGSSLLPYANVTYDLGSPAHRWRDLYLSGNTLTIGTQTISTDANGVVTSSNITVNGNLNAGSVSATYVAGTLTSSSQPSITSVGTLNNLTVAGNLATGDMTVTGNLATANLSATALNVVSISAGTITGNVVVPPGGNTQAPGTDSQLLFNSGGNTAAASGVTYNTTTGLLSIVGDVSGANLVSSGALSVNSSATIGGSLTSNNSIYANSGNVCLLYTSDAADE